jgi:antibiotic biosynthesis monooxygenase (ABM) superfamily enzyme
VQFTQHVVVEAQDEEALLTLAHEWKSAGAGVPGYLGGRVLRFRKRPGRYVIQADFDSWESAEANNDRQDTQEWAAKLAATIEGDPKYEDLDVLAVF